MDLSSDVSGNFQLEPCPPPGSQELTPVSNALKNFFFFQAFSFNLNQIMTSFRNLSEICAAQKIIILEMLKTSWKFEIHINTMVEVEQYRSTMRCPTCICPCSCNLDNAIMVLFPGAGGES